VQVEIGRKLIPLDFELQFQLWCGYQKSSQGRMGKCTSGRCIEKEGGGNHIVASVEGRKTKIRNSLIQPREI